MIDAMGHVVLCQENEWNSSHANANNRCPVVKKVSVGRSRAM